MLKRLFTSNTRIKLLTAFVHNPDEEYFIRELTRKLNEQINSVRRELDNLKKMGFLRCRTKNRKKYYHVNKNFVFHDELRSIILKASAGNEKLIKDLRRLGDLKALILSGHFVEKENAAVDMLIVGDINRELLQNYIDEQIRPARALRFTIMSESEYRYRLDCHDKFITDIINDPENEIVEV